MNCPECDREIDCLWNREFIAGVRRNEFWCPECNRLLSASDEAVIEFLEGV